MQSKAKTAARKQQASKRNTPNPKLAPDNPAQDFSGGEIIYPRSDDAPPTVPTAVGWEGLPPSKEIKSRDDLREYLEQRLARLREEGIGDHHRWFIQCALDDARKAIRNAMRTFDHLALADRPTPWPVDPKDGPDAERLLSELIHWLRKGGDTDAPRQPKGKGGRPTNPERDAQISRRLNVDGESAEAIALNLELQTSAVYKAVKRHEARNKPRP